jgi:hypothetical protein
LTIAPEAVVKFAKGLQITVETGGVLDALGSADLPIVFTSLADDAAGGDTNLDGSASRPAPGDWAGLVATGGQINLNESVSVRYSVVTHSFALAGNETWLGTSVHYVTRDVTVPDGATLIIQPGAVVKFDWGVSINVEAGGSLVAQGSVAMPITFTSLEDDSVGGDTNGNGNATSPAAGDWNRIYVNGGQATFDHVEIRYGAAEDQGQSGLVHTSGSAMVTIANSRLSEAFSNGVLAQGGSTTITNTIVTAADRGINSQSNSQVHVTNCTFDDNRVGMLVHGGTLDVANTIVSNSHAIGIQYADGTLNSVRYADVWAPTGSGSVNYSGTVDPTDTNGNISADPKYKDATRDDFRLNYRSPAIDAADGTAAPATDSMGAPRYNDPRTTTKTGVPDGNGNYPDMGAHEFVEGAESDVDLTVTSVSGSAAVVAGDMATLRWTVANVGTGTAVGPWRDSIYLVRDPGPNQVEIFAGDVVVGQGVTLGPGQSYVASGQVRVPGSTVGNHYWEVQTNSHGEIFEGQSTQNNTLVSAATVALDLPQLPIDGAAVSAQFSGVGDAHWFKFTPQAGQDILISLSLADAAGAADLYVGRGYMPDPQHFDAKEPQWNSPQVTALAADTSAQSYYVLTEASSLSGASAGFSIQAAALRFQLTSVTPETVGNGGPATLALHGGKLART